MNVKYEPMEHKGRQMNKLRQAGALVWGGGCNKTHRVTLLRVYIEHPRGGTQIIVNALGFVLPQTQ